MLKFIADISQPSHIKWFTSLSRSEFITYTQKLGVLYWEKSSIIIRIQSYGSKTYAAAEDV